MGAARVVAADGARLGERLLEPPGVDGFRGQPDRVAGWRGDQQAGRGPGLAGRLQEPAQVGDVRLEGGDGPGRRLAPPELVDHPVHGDDVAAGEQQQREHGTLPGPAEADLASVDLGLEGSKHPQQHDRAMVAAPTVPGPVVADMAPHASDLGKRPRRRSACPAVTGGDAGVTGQPLTAERDRLSFINQESLLTNFPPPTWECRCDHSATAASPLSSP
ncbi:hypothetical protein [Micromonospora sp. WMMD812]|uniref:hypothetical protein n=1 Tax=Micromonospora sp. WMMD812 TaxID=3015152 RepID=UPI00248B72C9|nr:hypothetical protein [Micromonospora sp. WMMD812]WBB68444.1 hypothetical protein O7603_03425 [Micromonospora sp. WMMD812]